MSDFLDFDPKDIFIREDSKKEVYEKLYTYGGKIADWGQLKLIVNEVLFLVNHWDTEKYPKIVLVVAGAGSGGQHYGPLLEMFPNIIRLDAWDTQDFALEGTTYDTVDMRIRYRREYMTYDKAKQVYRNSRENIFFISDIRSTKDEKGTRLEDLKLAPFEAVVWKDMKLQRELVEATRPIQSLLKFRVPFHGVEIEGVTGDSIEYFKGYIYTEVFNAKQSAELRLVPVKDEDGNFLTTNYNREDFEQKLMYYNLVRDNPHSEYQNSINGYIQINDSQLVNCFDTMYLLYTLDRYLYFIRGYREDVTEDERYYKTLSMWRWLYLSLQETLGKDQNLNNKRKRLRDKYEKEGGEYIDQPHIKEPITSLKPTLIIPRLGSNIALAADITKEIERYRPTLLSDTTTTGE